MLQAGRSRVSFPMRSLDCFNVPDPSSRTMVLGSAQPLTEMSTRNLSGGKGRVRLYNQAPPGVKISEQNYFLQDGVVSPMPNLHPGGLGSLS
jgi:hypothetical protein